MPAVDGGVAAVDVGRLRTMVSASIRDALEQNLIGGTRTPAEDLPRGKVINLAKAIEDLRDLKPYRVRGRVTEVTGLIIKAAVPGVKMGEMCWVTSPKDDSPPLRTEVVGFKDGAVFLMPLGQPRGLGPESEVLPTGKPFTIRCGYGLLGRTLSGVGDPIDGLG
jgi:flagellar biosynthesis/type III secretory pathway ATPase